MDYFDYAATKAGMPPKQRRENERDEYRLLPQYTEEQRRAADLILS